MHPQISRSQRILLKFLYVQGIIFGLSFFKIDKISKQIVESKRIKVLNVSILFICLINFLFLAFVFFWALLLSFSNTKLIVYYCNLICNLILIIGCYIFIYAKAVPIIEVLNEMKKYFKCLSDDLAIANVPGILMFQCIVHQPLWNLFLVTLHIYGLSQDFFTNIICTVPIILTYPCKQFIACLCILLNASAFLLEKMSDNLAYENFCEVLKTTFNVLEIYDSFIRFFLFCQFILILCYCFCVCSLLVTGILGNIALLHALIAVLYFMACGLVEVFDLWIVMESCKKVTKNVIKIKSVIFKL